MKHAESRKTAFLQKCEEKAHDATHKRIIDFNISKYKTALNKGKTQFTHLETARQIAKNTKWRAIEHLDEMLTQFEKKFTERGGKIIWAENAEEAQLAVLEICKTKGANRITKSMSKITEEIQLDAFLEKNNIEATGTDLGAFMLHLSGESATHMVNPTMHKSEEDIARLLHEEMGTEPALSPAKIAHFIRQQSRTKFKETPVSISGANFLIANEGAVCITENEGNISMSAAFPKTHIVIAGIEKILPDFKDLNLFWPLLATFGTGQKMTSFNSIFLGSRQQKENDGPDDMYVILLDNGRTNLLQKRLRESLYCIHCGACQNICPVYKNIGGNAYDSPYAGPIGAVITPHLTDLKSNGHLSFASSLCGACSESCPLHINIHNLLLENRRMFTKAGFGDLSEKGAWKLFQKSMLHRSFLNMTDGKTKRYLFQKLFSKNWGEHRASIDFAPKSFNQLWEKRSGQDEKPEKA